jgi:hypothetical protein
MIVARLHSARRFWHAFAGRSASGSMAFLVGIALALPLQGLAADNAGSAHIRGADMQSFGRLVLSFDRLPVVSVSQTNGVLTLNFDQPLTIDPSHLGLEVPNYVSAARLDPDKRAIRLALAKTIKVNLVEAGNDLYVDLLPPTWKGPMPTLPVEVVQALSRKARLADAAAKAGQVDKQRVLLADTASSNKLSRILFRGAASEEVHITKTAKSVEISFSGPWSLDVARLRAELPRGFASIAAESRDNALVVTITAIDGIQLDARPDEGGVLVDATFKGVGAIKSMLIPSSIITGATLAEPTPARSREMPPETKGGPPKPDSAPAFVSTDGENGPSFLLKGSGKIPLAVFSRANAAWIVLDTKIDPVLPSLSALKAAHALDLKTGRSGSLFYIRLEGKTPLFAAVQSNGEETKINVREAPPSVAVSIPLTPVPSVGGTYRLSAGVSGVGHIAQLDDPVVGDKIMIAPTVFEGAGVVKAANFPEFEVLASYQGLAVIPNADDIEMRAAVDEVSLSRADGLAVTDGNIVNGPQQIQRTVINRARWERDKTDHVIQRQNELTEIAAAAQVHDQKKRRLELARFLAANGLYREAVAAFMSAFNDRIKDIDDPRDRLELGILEALGHDWRAALDNLSDIRLANTDEAILWRAYLAAQSGRFSESLGEFRRSGDVFGLYPEDIQTALRMMFAEAAIESSDWGMASDMEKGLRARSAGADSEILNYYRARIREASGELEEAHKAYEGLINSPQRGVEVRAKAALTALDLKLAQIEPDKALDTFENLAVFWRGDFLEAKLLAAAARVALDTKKWRNAFASVQRLNRLYADTDGVRPLLEEVTLRFDGLIGGDQPYTIGPVDAVALFMEFREFMPTGRRADELIRKYIERLADLDLIPQATELLRYQIEYRLEGVPRAASAVRLASLYLIDHKPIEAIRVLSETRSNGLPDDLRAARRLIEARARSDLGETQAANELLEGLQGREASIVRAEVYWKAKDWMHAGENYEAALGDTWRNEEALSADDLKIALRAAASYVLAGDSLANDRFRGRYRAKLAATPESGVFRLLTAPANVQKPIAAGVSADKGDPGLLDSFLKSYRTHYGLGGAAASTDGTGAVTSKPAG